MHTQKKRIVIHYLLTKLMGIAGVAEFLIGPTNIEVAISQLAMLLEDLEEASLLVNTTQSVVTFNLKRTDANVDAPMGILLVSNHIYIMQRYVLFERGMKWPFAPSQSWEFLEFILPS